MHEQRRYYINMNNLMEEINIELRDKKDKLKELVKTGNLPRDSKFQIIFPPHLFKTSLEFQSDQWYMNGFVINEDGKLTVVDPGVGFYLRFINAGLKTEDIHGLIATHEHIDHIADLSVFIEKIIRNKGLQIDVFFAPNVWGHILTEYQKGVMSKYEHILLHHEIQNTQFVRLYHSDPETIGFKKLINDRWVGYVSDTGYTKIPDQKIAENIREFYKDCEIAIVNINDIQFNRHSKFHLSGHDVKELFKDTKVQEIWLQHLSVVNAEGEDSNYIYKFFFRDQPYDLYIPAYTGRIINI